MFKCAPSGARFQRVKVSNPPGSGKDIVEGKGVHREVESEGSRMLRMRSSETGKIPNRRTETTYEGRIGTDECAKQHEVQCCPSSVR